MDDAVREPVSAVRPGRPNLELFGATVALVTLGLAAVTVLLLIPGIVLDWFGYPRADAGRLAGLHGLPVLALGPAVIVLGLAAGHRMGRERRLSGAVRAGLVVIAGVMVSQLLGVYGEGLASAAAIMVWAVGLAPIAAVVARVGARRPGPLLWVGVALAGLVVVDLAVTVGLWLSVGPVEAPRAYAAAWFPTVLLEPAVRLPLGAEAGSARAALVDAAEFLPHALLAAAAFGLAYLRAATRPSAGN
ncbi:hypothetical protein [Micromonospora viridifaciens]|nr:hypothetical protein [Micromonospora viridifaciens]